jgi:hypothetical protein
MKTRNGFVSNSSTTSFTCDVCGHVEGYHDSLGYSDIGAYGCENGHSFCDKHLLPKPKNLEPQHQELDEDDECKIDSHYELSAIRCPLCQLTTMNQSLMEDFLLKALGWTKKQALEEAKIRGGGTYAGLLAYLGKRKPRR